MLRANSLTAVAMRAWSMAPKPSALAVSRARVRAMTISRSLRMTAALEEAIAALLGFSAHHLQSLLEVQGCARAAKLQAKLHQGDRDGGLEAGEHHLCAHEARHGGDVGDQAADEAVDDVNRGHIDDHAPRLVVVDLLQQIVFELHRGGIVERHLDRSDQDVPYFQNRD